MVKVNIMPTPKFAGALCQWCGDPLKHGYWQMHVKPPNVDGDIVSVLRMHPRCVKRFADNLIAECVTRGRVAP